MNASGFTAPSRLPSVWAAAVLGPNSPGSKMEGAEQLRPSLLGTPAIALPRAPAKKVCPHGSSGYLLCERRGLRRRHRNELEQLSPALESRSSQTGHNRVWTRGDGCAMPNRMGLTRDAARSWSMESQSPAVPLRPPSVEFCCKLVKAITTLCGLSLSGRLGMLYFGKSRR